MANFVDNLTAIDGTSLVDHFSDTGQAWTANGTFSGTGTINSGAVSSADDLKLFESSWVPPSPDYEVTVLVNVIDGISTGPGDNGFAGMGAAVRVSGASGINGYGTLLNGHGVRLLDMNVDFPASVSFTVANEPYRVTCGIIGTALYGRVQRVSDGLWLNAAAGWQVDQNDCVTATVTTVSVAGNAGIWLTAGANSTPPMIDKVIGRGNTGLVVTSPKTLTTIQRDFNTLLGAITITGTYTGTPTAIKASLDGGTAQTIVASPTGGTFSGTLQDVPAGQGDLVVYWENETDVSATVADIGVGERFGIGGQSNAVGDGTNPQSYSGTFKATIYSLAGAHAELIEPFGGNAGSCWPKTATDLMAHFDCPVDFVPFAVDGSSITGWQPDQTNYTNAVDRMTASGGTFRGILWWQGETDAIAGMSQATYNGYLDAMANAFAADVGAPVIACLLQNSSAITDADEAKIRAAVVEAANDNANVHLGPDLSDIGSDDAYHLQSDTKLTTAGQRWALAIIGELFEPTLNISTDLTGVIMLVGEATEIDWIGVSVDDVDILLSLDGGSTYTVTLTSSLTNGGSYAYTPDQAHVTATAKIKVRSSADALVLAESDAFKIATTTPTTGGGSVNSVFNLPGCPVRTGR